MDYFDVVNSRRSVRVFAEKAIEENKIQQVLETANRAPSAGNLQAYEIYVVRDNSIRSALAHASLDQGFIADAPVVLVFCAHPARSAGRYRERGIRLYAVQDATIACTFAMLASTALGLSSVWVGAFNDDSVRDAIKIPPTLLPVAILPIGYPAEEPGLRPRRKLDDIIHEIIKEQ